MKNVIDLNAPNICINSAMRSVLTSHKVPDRLTSFMTSVFTDISVRNALKKAIVQNDCLLLTRAKTPATVLSSDEDKFLLEHDHNELYFNSRLIVNNLNVSVPILLTRIKKVLSKQINGRRLEITLSVQTGEFPSVTVYIHTLRESVTYLGDIDSFSQPVLHMIF